MDAETKQHALEVLERLREVQAQAARVTSPDDVKKAQKLLQQADAIQDRLDAQDAQRQKAEMFGGAVKGSAPFLGLEQKAAGHFKSESVDFDPQQVRLGAILAAYVNGDAKSQLNAEEQKAFSSLLGPQGDLLIPTAIGREFIDAVRPKTQVLAAGGRTYPMEARSVILPGWDVPPKAGWRGEGGNFADAGGKFREVTLNAKDVGAFTDIPNVLFEDAASSNLGTIGDIIEGQLSKAIAQAIDLAALTSQDALTAGGTQVPIGLTSVASDGTVSPNYGVSLATSSGTNGGTPTYDWFIDAAAAVAGNNFTPTAHLGSSRTFATLGKLKTTTNEYLPKPPYLAGVTDYSTNQLGTTYKKGSSLDTSISVVGDFSNLVVGMRGDLHVLRDPYTQGLSRTTRLIVALRADVAVLQKGAFQVIDGLRP